MRAWLSGALRSHEDDGGDLSGRTLGEAEGGSSIPYFRLIRERSEGEAKCMKGGVIGFVADGECSERRSLGGQHGNVERSGGGAGKAIDPHRLGCLGETDSRVFVAPRP